MSEYTDKVCPIMFSSRWNVTHCVGEQCAWFSKCYTPTLEVDESDYLKRENVADLIFDLLQRIGCDDDDIYDVVRAIEKMPGERVTSGRESDGVAFKSDCGWSYGEDKD